MKIKTAFRKVIATIGLTAVSSGYAMAADQVELSFADSFPLKHYLSKEGMVWWMNRASELSNGSIKFRHFPAGQLAKAKGILGKVSGGAVDAGYVGIGYATDKLPLSGVSMLPGLTKDPVVGSNTFWKMVSKGSLRQEFDKNKVVPLFAVILPGYQLALGKEPVESIDNMAGVKLRTSGSMNLTAEAMGATPISMSAPEIYMGMQRGTLDGTLIAAISMKPYNLQDTVKSFSTNALFGSFAVTAVMNKKEFDALSSEQQKAVMQAGEDTVVHLSNWMKESENKAQTELAELGIEIYEVSEEVLAEMEKKTQPVQRQWAERMDSRGLDGSAALSEFKNLVSK